MKFARRTGGTNKLTKKTLSADQVIGEIINGNNCFIPISVGHFGDLGSLFGRFLSGDNVIPITSLGNERPNAQRTYELAKHISNPYYILGKADGNWKRNHGDSLYSFSYLAPFLQAHGPTSTLDLYARQALPTILKHLLPRCPSALPPLHFPLDHWTIQMTCWRNRSTMTMIFVMIVISCMGSKLPRMPPMLIHLLGGCPGIFAVTTHS